MPVKVKYFQTFPNKTKNADRITYRFNMLKINEIQNFRILVYESVGRRLKSCLAHHDELRTGSGNQIAIPCFCFTAIGRMRAMQQASAALVN